MTKILSNLIERALCSYFTKDFLSCCLETRIYPLGHLKSWNFGISHMCFNGVKQDAIFFFFFFFFFFNFFNISPLTYAFELTSSNSYFNSYCKHLSLRSTLSKYLENLVTYIQISLSYQTELHCCCEAFKINVWFSQNYCDDILNIDHCTRST
jgi:hypothetical protein